MRTCKSCSREKHLAMCNRYLRVLRSTPVRGNHNNIFFTTYHARASKRDRRRASEIYPLHRSSPSRARFPQRTNLPHVLSVCVFDQLLTGRPLTFCWIQTNTLSQFRNMTVATLQPNCVPHQPLDPSNIPTTFDWNDWNMRLGVHVRSSSQFYLLLSVS